MLLKVKEIELNLPRISNYILFEKPELIEPQVPKFFITSQNRWVENPSHPDYVEGLEFYKVAIANYAYNLLLQNVKLVDSTVLENKKWKATYRRILQTSNEIPDNNDEIFLFLKNFVLDNNEDRNLVVNKVCLTESKVYKYFERFGITRFGENIHNVEITNSINTGIAFTPIIIGNDMLVNPIDEWSACTKSNMNWETWLTNGYSLDTMAITIAVQRLNKLTELHSEDEQAKQQNKKNK